MCSWGVLQLPLRWESAPFGAEDLEPGAAEAYRSPTSSLRRKNEVRCCVRGCSTWLRPRGRKGSTDVCPLHGISISTSPTYVYRDWKHNLILRHDLMDRVKRHKVESWRLENEGSEDALSWNVIIGLAHLDGLRDAFEAFTGCRARAEPQLFFWGMEVWPDFRPGTWGRLSDARAEFREAGSRIPTEPDIAIRVAGQALVLIEAKFGSPNGTLEHKRDITVAKFVERYCSSTSEGGPFDRKAIGGMRPDEVLEQLCRNVAFANYMATGGEEAFVVNLVRAEAETDVKERMQRHLSTRSRVRFRRITWEDLARLPSLQHDEAANLRSYVRTKTLRLRPAFKHLE